MAKTIAPAQTEKDTGDQLIELPKKPTVLEGPTLEGSMAPKEEVSLVEVKKRRSGLLQSLGKLKPLLPVLSSGLRMVDHGAVQALAHLLNLAEGPSGASNAAHEGLQHGLAEIESNHHALHLQVQAQTVEVQRLEDQITLLRETVERDASRHEELAEKVRSLGNLVRVASAGLAILLVILITLAVLVLTRHP